MRAGRRKLALSLCAAACSMALVCGPAGLARADDNDLTLERLIGRPAMPGTTPVITPATRSAYTGLVSELGVVMAPRALEPSDTTGWSGFAVALDTGFTQISRDADFWQRGVRAVSSPLLTTIGASFKKGLWLPFPSLELGFGGKKLIDSGMFALDFSAKLAVHEGFHRWPIPSIALRVAVAQVFGAPQLALTVLDAGLLVSKRFAVGGALQLDPYVGVDAIVSFATSQVVDTTPEIDAYRQGPNAPDANANVTLPDPGTLPRVRIHAGLRLRVSLFQATIEGSYVLCNATGRGCGQGGDVEVVDRSGGQAQLGVSLGVVY